VGQDKAWCNRLLSGLRRAHLRVCIDMVAADTDIAATPCDLWLLTTQADADRFLAAYRQADSDTPVVMLGRTPHDKMLPAGVEWLQVADENLILQCLTWRLQWQATQRHCHQLRQNLALLDRQYQDLLADSPKPTVLIRDDRMLTCNIAFKEFLDAGTDAALAGQRFSALFCTGDKQTLGRLYTSAALAGSRHTLVTKTRQRLACQFSTGIYQGEPCLCLTVQKQTRQTDVATQPFVDILAQLENLPVFHQRLEAALAAGQGKCSMLLVARIDNFQRVLETLGKATTMQVVTDIAGFLGKAISKPYTASKLGADEFGILLFDCAADEAIRVADYIRSRVNNSLLPPGIDALDLSASIGLASIHRQGQTAEALIHRARLNTGNTVQVAPKAPARQQLVSLLRNALKRQTLPLAFQPLIALRAPARSAYKVSWQLPGHDSSTLATQGLMAEANMQGYGMATDRCVLQQLFTRNAVPRHAALYLVSLSSNTLAELAFPAWFSRVCHKHDRSPEQFRFVISEIDMHSHRQQVMSFCKRLDALGISWHLSDFGRAMDPLAVLAQVTPVAVHLDPAWLGELQYSKPQQESLEKLVAAVHQYGIAVLATEVADSGELPQLFSLGIDGVQGNGVQAPSAEPDYGFPQSRTLTSAA